MKPSEQLVMRRVQRYIHHHGAREEEAVNATAHHLQLPVERVQQIIHNAKEHTESDHH